MSKFMYFTDLHIAGKNPRKRVDDYPDAIVKKLKQVYDIAKENNVDACIFGGDLCNSHRLFRYDILVDIIDTMDSSGLETYAIIGQHDLQGYNKSSFRSSTLALIEHFSSTFKVMWDEVEFDDCVLYPCHVYDDLTEKLGHCVPKDKKSILVAHKLLSKDMEVFDVVLTSKVETEFDVVLSGDLHSGVPPHMVGKTTFYNPGSLARISKKDIDRMPKVGIIHIGEEVSVDEVTLNVPVGDEVFDWSITEDIKEKIEVDTSRFIEGIMQLENDAVDIFDLVRKAAQKKGVRKEVVSYILSKRQ